MPSSSHAMALNPKAYQAAHMALVAGMDQEPPLIINSVLNKLQSHDLLRQSTAALMNRVDTKYLLPQSVFGELLTTLAQEYTVLTEQGRSIFNYETTYFDTEQNHFYLAHHNGKLNRHKVRFRRYVQSNCGFMEVKLKNNKGRTIKNRVPMDCLLPDASKINDFVQDSIGESIPKLQASLFVNYRRITLLNKTRPERLTLDLDLNFQCANTGQTQKLKDVFVVELKRDGKMQHSIFSSWLNQHNISPIKFSKYCMGMVLTHDKNLKQNRFKPTISQLTKITGVAPWN